MENPFLVARIEPMPEPEIIPVPADVVEEATPVVPTDEIVDSVEAAAILDVNLNNLRQIVFKKQLLPIGKRGRRLLFNRSDVEELLRQRGK